MSTRLIATGAVAALLIAPAAVTSVYTQPEGTANVIVSMGGQVSGVDTTPGFGLKGPWPFQSTVQFDIRNQLLSFAGTADDAPAYTDGNVNGAEVTVAVAGGASANIDVQVNYSIDPSKVADIYRNYGTQENFTSQIVVPKVLSALRAAAAQFEPIAFRGDSRADANSTALAYAVSALEDYGVVVTSVDIQDVRYSQAVEDSLQAVQTAENALAEAQANAEALRVSSEAEANANRTVADSVTPELIEMRKADAMHEAARNGSLIVVPEGSQPIVDTRE